MAYNWYYKHGDTVPNTSGTLVKSQANLSLRGNIIHFDPLNGILKAAHPDNPGVEENGSENFPYKSIQEYFNDLDAAVHTIKYCLFAPTCVIDVSTIITNAIALVDSYFTSDRKYSILNNTGLSSLTCFCTWAGRGSQFSGLYGFIIKGFYAVSSALGGYGAMTPRLQHCRIECAKIGTSINTANLAEVVGGKYSIHKGAGITEESSWYYLDDNMILVNQLMRVSNDATYTRIANKKVIFVNCEVRTTSDITNLSSWHDGGKIKVGSQVAYNIDTEKLTKTEVQMIADIEALFDTEYGGTHSFSNLKISTPPFISKTKDNYLFDAENANSLTYFASGYGIGVGLSCDFNSTSSSDFVNSVSSPHFSSNDGFNGVLYCRNLKSDGSIDVAADDAVWVTKKYTFSDLSLIKQINFAGIVNSIEINDPENFEIYIAVSLNNKLESIFNSSKYTFTYSAGVLTIDFPRMNFGENSQRINRLTNSILAQIENGSYNFDTGRNKFSNTGNEFRLIIVKRGV